VERASVTPYRNGPYLVRGDFELLDQDGNTIQTGRRTIALCRCGKSRSRPFCDGTHKAIGFQAEGAPEGDALRALPVVRERSSASELAERGMR
jgi:CDGSH-type Zn-finger protein